MNRTQRRLKMLVLASVAGVAMVACSSDGSPNVSGSVSMSYGTGYYGSGYYGSPWYYGGGYPPAVVIPPGYNNRPGGGGSGTARPRPTPMPAAAPRMGGGGGRRR